MEHGASLRRRIAEPGALATSNFLMYLCSFGLLFLLAIVGGCKWKGSCNAPLGVYLPVIVSHWIIIGAVLEKDIQLARILLVPFGLGWFIFFGCLSVFDKNSRVYWVIIEIYLSYFGFIYPIYLFKSEKVKKYIEYQKEQ